MSEPKKRGIFITFEGGEGAGKSTQIRRLAARLDAVGQRTLVTREPGGTAGAEIIRSLILDPARPPLTPLAETLLFFAARADHLDIGIRPALDEGQWVLCDRFTDSTRIYQGVVGGVTASLVDHLEALVIHDTMPDLTILLDIPVDIGLARAHARRGQFQADRFESESYAIHENLRVGFLELAERQPKRIVVISADGDEEQISHKIWALIKARFELHDEGASS